ncbi:WecB/TagA/CpsF family glycosyltransferase [Rhodothermus bifroesti]|uniref:WecB/TagA/CpsF family glycosyltransferase n=1 Tax=Rhodothermus bifroesti TaxID=2823335 RepID=UPI001AEFE9D7|nr:WecB/TagA/CpsF family glycosyltransferase [Rhodothermus bifroesti]
MPQVQHRYILGMRVDATSYAWATKQIIDWAEARESRYVCAANVHMVMEAYDSPDFRAIVNAADLVTPDGMPLVWTLRRMGIPKQERVYGPTLTLWVAQEAARCGIPVGFYGGHPEATQGISENLSRRFSGLQVSYCYSPPFRPLTPEEDKKVVEAINASGTRILFVGLGCPKQEYWMAAHKGQIQAVMVGVGAAFDFHAGRIRQAPFWLQQMGLEWFFRLLMEPRRLWRRYVRHNPRFVVLVGRQLLKQKGHAL